MEEAAQLSAQLPLLIRGLYFEGWDPTGKPLRIRHADEFRALIREKYAPRFDIPVTDILRALFRVLERHVSRGEVTDIMLSLPSEIVQLVGRGESLDERAQG